MTEQHEQTEEQIAATPAGPQREALERENQVRSGQVDDVVNSCLNCPATLTAAVGMAMSERNPEKARGLADRAVDAAERAKKDPRKTEKLVNALNTRGALLVKSGEYDRARADAEYALKIRPGDKNALALLHMTSGRGKSSPGTAPPPVGGRAAPAPATNSGEAAAATPAQPVAMTSPASLEARKQLALGWSRLALDPAAALKSFEAAITADPLSAAVRVQRSKARLTAGDAPGALGDAEDAVRMEPRLGEAYAARAEAMRALGRAEAELLSDYETASGLDARFTQAYKALSTRLASSSAGAQADGSNTDAAAGSAPDGFRGWRALPKKRGLMTLLLVLAAAAGGLLAAAWLKKRRP
ncbi:MAG: hypothetical protein Q8T11_04000 [Elusimicrobiota bacterium]|nr:hypothetical protein [Elusimicrobiota bacterium]